MTILKNQIAMVTGASGGIGGAIAAGLARHGAILCICGRDRVKLESAAARWRSFSPRVDAAICDLSVDAEIDALCGQVANAHGRLDILVHCAGTIEHGRLEQAPLEQLDQQYRTNVRGPMRLTQGLLPLLKSPRGQVVVVNSSAGLSSAADRGHYSATKHALKALTDTLRDEINADGVRVLSVFPGRTATPAMQAIYERAGRAYQPELLLQPEDVAEIVLSALALPWTAEVTNISIRPMQKSY